MSEFSILPPPDSCCIQLILIDPPSGQPFPGEVTVDKIPWCAFMMLDVAAGDLAGLMQRGLFWTTQNILGSADGEQLPWKDLKTRFGGDESDEFPWKCYDVLFWRLCELPSRPVDESRWTGQIFTVAHLPQTLSNFRLGQLRRPGIHSVSITDASDKLVFRFDLSGSGESFNHVFDKPPSDLWWVWPMETIVPQENLGPGLPYRGSIRSGDVEKASPVEKPCPHDHRSESRQEAALLLLATRLQSLAWGLTLLLYAASMALVLLSVVAAAVLFGGMEV